MKTLGARLFSCLLLLLVCCPAMVGKAEPLSSGGNRAKELLGVLDDNARKIKLISMRSNTLVLTGDTIYFAFYTFDAYQALITVDVPKGTVTIDGINPAGSTWTMHFASKETEEGRTIRQMTGFPLFLLEPKGYFAPYILDGYDSGPEEFTVVARVSPSNDYPQIRARINTSTSQFVEVVSLDDFGNTVSTNEVGGYSMLHDKCGFGTFGGLVLPLTSCRSEFNLQNFLMEETYFDDIYVETGD